MCKFFSLVSDGNGKPYYFNWALRQKVLSGMLKYYEPDSHTSIADYFGFKNEKEDTLNKYEYDPFLRAFVVDQINTKDDSEKVERFCRQLDFKKVIEPMTIKKIIHPFKDVIAEKATNEDLYLLNQVVEAVLDVHVNATMQFGASDKNDFKFSILSAAKDSIRASIIASVGQGVWKKVKRHVWASVGVSTWDSLWDCEVDDIGLSVKYSCEKGPLDSFSDSIIVAQWAQIGSMFDVPVWTYCNQLKATGYPFQAYVDLWNKGLVPSFDGDVWRLHGGHNGKILLNEIQHTQWLSRNAPRPKEGGK